PGCRRSSRRRRARRSRGSERRQHWQVGAWPRSCRPGFAGGLPGACQDACAMTVISDLDGVLVASRAVFLNCVRHAFDKLGLPARTDDELLPYIGPPFAYAFGELLQVPHDAPIVDACIDGYRERYKDASLTETTVFPG